MGQYFLGIDIGTSSVRAVLFDEQGGQKHMESIDCSIISSFEGFAELEPEMIFNSVISVISKCIACAGVPKGDIAAMGLSCHMHSLMLVDSSGNPLSRLMLWADTRAKREAKHIEDNYYIKDIYKITGCRVHHPMYPLSKILWLKNNQAEIFSKTYKFITIKEYIIQKLYGEYVVDYTLASSQGYFNIHKQDWEDSILHDILGIGKDRLSTPVEATYTLKGMKQEYAFILGVDKNIPMIIGSGDGIMANLGCGVFDDTSLSSTIGTSGAIRTSVSSPLLDPDMRTWCYSFTKDTWVAGGAINNGGLVLKWLQETFKQQFEHDASELNESIYEVFSRYAAETPVASDGLIFLPYLTGERSPDWNAEVRGLIYGLDYSHGRKHIIRAAMEGVMYRLYSVYEVMAKLNDNGWQIRANGGYVKSEPWLQIQADIFNKEILVPEALEASALGAAYLAMLSLGAVSDMKQMLPVMEPQKNIKPIEENHELYMKNYELSKQIYGSIYNKQ